MPRIKLIAVCSLASALLGAPAYADPTPAAATGSPAPLTLAQALRRAPAPRSDVYLAVDADKVNLPKDAPATDADARIPEIAEAYGYIVRDFHGVTSVAPPTMTVLNTDPGKPNPYDGMPPPDAFKLLLAGLDDGQWSLLTGTTGLGISDLATDAQRQLFAALFPGKEMTLYPRKGGVQSYGGEDEKTLLKLSQANALAGRLRLKRRVQLSLPIAAQPNAAFIADAPEGGAGVYQMYNGDFGSGSRDTIYGAKLRAAIPNTPKPTDLDFDADSLSTPIDLANVVTVGDLVGRIGYATQTEFYADRRLEKRPIVIIGPRSARAKDLLQALSLCVAGTYRKVGGAYLLTNDLMGVGTRHMILTRFVQEAEIQRKASITAAGDKVFSAHPSLDLASQGDAFALSDAQMDVLRKGRSPTPSQFRLGNQPLGALTLSQQAALRQMATDWNAAHPVTPNSGDDPSQVTLDRPIDISIAPTVTLDTPATATPVVMDSYLQAGELLSPSPALRDELFRKEQEIEEQKRMAEEKAHPHTHIPVYSPPKLVKVMAGFSRRAVIARPRTAIDVDKIVADMKSLGFKELWLDAFSEGQNRLGANDGILKEALAKAKGAGISVIARLDVLNWGASPPKDARDLTMIGETSAEADAVGQRWSSIVNLGMSPEDAQKQTTQTEVFVSPGDSAVTETLANLVKHLAATPGIAGIALRETSVHGYDRPFQSHFQVGDYSLGYTPPLRLDFLRRDHVDPVDLEPDIYGSSVDVNTSLPEFDDWGLEVNAKHDWSDYRADLLHAFLARLLRTAQTSGNHPVDLFIKAQLTLDGRADWYGRWDNPHSPIPTLTEEQAYQGAGDTQYARYAHARWRENIFNVVPGSPLTADDFAWGLSNVPDGWDGFVLDLTGDASGLGDLANSVKAAGKATSAPTAAK